jgi:hypothetical protein
VNIAPADAAGTTAGFMLVDSSAAHGGHMLTDADTDFWWMQPLCPPTTLDALEAFRQLHRELKAWVADNRRHDADKMEFWHADEAKRRKHVYGNRAPLAQIAWLTGPKDWPAALLMGRSYSGKIFMHQGKRHYLEPADDYVLGMMPLD